MHIGLLLLALGTFGGTAPAPRNGEDVIRLMHDKYAGKWYSTLTFVQKTTTDKGVETWYEAGRFPGFLRIDIAPLDSGKAIVFRNDTIYNVEHGAVTQARPLIHPLMVLGFDVYAQPVDTTIAKLKRLSFDLSKLTAGTWQGKKVWIVGTADSADTKAMQFWVTQDDLLFVRMLRTSPRGQLSETQFNKYYRLGNAWLSPEVVFNVDGKLQTKEEYSDAKIGMTFEPNLFDPAKFARPGWVK